MNTSVETLARTVATAELHLPLSASAETGLTGTPRKDLVLRWRPNLTKAWRFRHGARREERNGFPYTAALKWRDAAELFAPDTRDVEYCWREWERIMQLPRRLSGPAYADPEILPSNPKNGARRERHSPLKKRFAGVKKSTDCGDCNGNSN
jgi:hypothetical protein